jgi:hypothetical protein
MLQLTQGATLEELVSRLEVSSSFTLTQVQDANSIWVTKLDISGSFGVTQAAGDARWLQLTGGTLTGTLNLTGGVPLQLNASTILTSAGVLQNVTTDAGIVTTGTLAVARGGTNLGSYTAGDLIYASAGTTFTKLGIGLSAKYLRSSGTAPTWATIDLSETTGSILSSQVPNLDAAKITTGTMAVARGGTGIPSGNWVIGDIIYATGTNTLSQLGIGAASSVLITNSTATAPVWTSIIKALDGVRLGPSALPAAGVRSTALFYLESLDSAANHAQIWLNSADTSGPAFILGKTRGTVYDRGDIVVAGDILGTVEWYGGDGGTSAATPTRGAYIRAVVTGTPANSNIRANLEFWSRNAAGTEGNTFTIGTTGNVTAVGTMTATNFILSSDVRLKTSVARLDERYAVKALAPLAPHSFYWLKQSDEERRRHIGLLAQDIQQTIPEAVYQDEAGFLRVDPMPILSLAIGALNYRGQQVDQLIAWARLHGMGIE